MCGHVPVPADYDGDGDGAYDLAVWRPSTGVWSVLENTTTFGPASGVQLAIPLCRLGDPGALFSRLRHAHWRSPRSRSNGPRRTGRRRR